MKKGLKIVLEQLRPPRVTPTLNDDSSGDAPTQKSTVTPSPTPTQGPNFEETLNQRMSDMFNVFDVFDGNDTELVKKLSDSDRDAIKGNVIRRLKGDFGDNLSDMDLSILDDTFVNYMVDYMVDNKNMEPFYIRYIPTNVYKITPKRIVEAVGLMKVLVEQGLSTDREILYINYKAGGGFEIIGGPGARNQASANFRSQKGDKMIQPKETGVGKRQTQQQPQQKPEQPEKRPEEEMEVNPKANMVQKKAEKEGVESVIKNLSQEQQRVLRNYTNQDWTTEKPSNQDANIMDIIDLSKQEESFKVFKTFPMYRPKRMAEQNLESYSELLDAQNVDRGMCKSTVKVFYDAATERKRLSDNTKKQFADYITACNLQFKNFMDLGITKSKIEALENKMGNNPSYQINYSARTIGGNKF
jgi:hypothetical protein